MWLAESRAKLTQPAEQQNYPVGVAELINATDERLHKAELH